MSRRSRRSVLGPLAVVAAIAVVAVWLPASAPSATPKTVRVQDFSFGPKSVTVRRNTVVVWRWVGAAPHNVKGRGFKSAIKTSGRYQYRFRKRGRYSYLCEVHAVQMRGTVVVR